MNIHNDMSARKISEENENFIDNVLINFTEKLNPFYKRVGITPNMLTTLSLVITMFALYIYHKAKCNCKVIYVGVFLYFVGYYFDCADGNMARKYNMTSKFGDMYDHISDISKFLVTIYIIYKTAPKSKFHNYFKVIVILGLLSCIQIGCQELLYGNSHESPSLNAVNLCKMSSKPESTIKITKYFGSGTFYLCICIMLLYAKVDNCKLLKKSKKLR